MDFLLNETKVFMNEKAILKTRDVLKLLGISRATWHTGIKKGMFPKPMRLSPGKRDGYWLREDVLAILASAKAQQ
jgi:predicted DNA-binding transcriptional regulator AlpA